MKNILIGDIHGRTEWKDIINQEKDFDKIVFVGDYLDSYDISIEQQINNFRDIIQFKKDNKDKVTLLWGNHDCSYYTGYTGTSGFRDITFVQLNNEIIEYWQEGLFEVATKVSDYVVSHAGITNTFWERLDEKLPPNVLTDIESLTEIYAFSPRLFEFGHMSKHLRMDNYGDDIFQSPMWIRPNSLYRDKKFPKQIVGHTQVKHNGHIRPNSDIIQIDALAIKEYLVIENDIPRVGKINK